MQLKKAVKYNWSFGQKLNVMYVFSSSKQKVMLIFKTLSEWMYFWKKKWKRQKMN